MSEQLDVSVVLIIFNRPKETARAFAAIREARPRQLFVIADGPRNEADRSLCEAARAVVEKGVDWPCVVHRNYAEKNLGCGYRPATGITWVFEQVEQAIILEDDCIAHPSFFPFAQELLEKYAHDERVMHIVGNCFQENNSNFNIRESYYASFIPMINGWATWRRAWKFYDFDIKEWPALRESRVLIDSFHNHGAYDLFEMKWDSYYKKHVKDSWDGQWALACMSRGGISLTASVNLISNIGFNERATHTKSKTEQAEMRIHAMHFPLTHPKELMINREADNYVYRYHFGVDKQFRQRLMRPFKNHFPNIYKNIKRLLEK